MDIRPYPAEPTTIPPGPAKEAVFLERLADGCSLHHPADARYEGDLLPHQWMKWKAKQEQAATDRILDKIKRNRDAKNAMNPSESEELG